MIIRRGLLFVLMMMVLFACERPDPTAPTPGTVTVPPGNTALPNRVADGPIPGCVDALELVAQTLTMPALQVTFDAGGIIDRVGAVATGAVYAFSTRPVNPVDCSSIPEAPVLAMPSVSFGFNYLGDFTRVDPVCMNASSLELTAFSVTGTPLDAAIEPIAYESIWIEVDRAIDGFMQSFLNGTALPATANPRCDNWVDLATL